MSASGGGDYAARVEKAPTKPAADAWLQPITALPLPRNYLDFVGRQLFGFLSTVQGVGAFALITLGVTCTIGLGKLRSNGEGRAGFSSLPRPIPTMVRPATIWSALGIFFGQPKGVAPRLNAVF